MLKLKQLLTINLVVLALIISGCSHQGPHMPSPLGKPTKKEKKETPDGPPEIDMDVTHIPNATPKIEPLSRYGNPAKYRVFGEHYHTLPHSRGYAAEGTASWYGRKFHGQRTSSGEPYDMFGMTAAHRSLPLPTYAKVKNLVNGREVIVKINDRGPFVKDRLIDLSYAAAKKLGMHASGTGKVRITAIDPAAWDQQQKEQTKTAQKSKTTNQKQKGQALKQKAQSSTQVAQKSEVPKPKGHATKQKGHSSEIKVAQKSDVAKSKEQAANTKPSTATKTTQVAKANKKLYIQLGTFSKETNAKQLAKRATTLTQALDHVDVQVLSGKSANKESYKVRIGPLKDQQQAQHLQKKLLALDGGQGKLIYD